MVRANSLGGQKAPMRPVDPAGLATPAKAPMRRDASSKKSANLARTRNAPGTPSKKSTPSNTKNAPKKNGGSKALGASMGSSGASKTPASIMVPRLLLIISTAALVIFGLVMVYSSSYVEAFTNPGISDSGHIFRRQAIMVGIALMFMIAAALIDYRIWNSLAAWGIWLVIVIFLIATLFFGTEINGGTRWITVFGQQFQPSEFAKPSLVLLVAMLIIKLRESVAINSTIITLGAVIGLPVALIMLQPDLGTTIIIFAGVIALAWFGELSMKPIAIAGLLVLFMAASAVLLVGFRMDRIDAWLDPFSYVGTSGYQIVNSFYAFAGGGIGGVGLGMSHQKYLYLPEPYNDLIFPIIGEEFGLIGTVFVVALFLVFLYASFKIARNAPDLYGRMIAGSAATLIGFQAFLNMLCMVNLIPMTGKPLPFFSAGGSAIIGTLVLTGLILNVSLRSKAIDPAKERREELVILDGGPKIERSRGVLKGDNNKKLPPSPQPMAATPVRAQSKSASKKPSRRSSEAKNPQAAPDIMRGLSPARNIKRQSNPFDKRK